MQTNSEKNNYNPDLQHDSDEQLETNINFDDEDLSEEEFNDHKNRNQWLKWIKFPKQKLINNHHRDLTETKLSFLRNCSACFLCASLILFCVTVILYFATYPSLNNVKVILNVLVAFSLAANIITFGCYLALRWWLYLHAKSFLSNQLYFFKILRWGLIVLFIICFVLLEIWWILFSISTINNLTLTLSKLYDSWSILLGCIWFLFSIVLLSYFVIKSMLNKAIELKHLWFWLIFICFFVFLVIAYFVFGALGINHESLIPGKSLFLTACVICIFGIYPALINYRLYLNKLFY